MIHYKSPQSTTTTACGRKLAQLSISWSIRPEAVTCAKCQKHSDVIRAGVQAVEHAQSKQKPAKIAFEIDHQLAWAFAQFLKRSTFTTYRDHAVDEREAYQIRDAVNIVEGALREQGFSPR